MIRASVVLPVYERADLLRACLAALERAGLGGLELILVDNASCDPAMGPLLRAWESSARVVRNEANLGFARACNQGTAIANGPVVAYLNTDTEVTAGWLEPLIEEAVDPGVGMVGARLLYPDGRVQHAGMAMTPGGTPVHIHRGAPGTIAAAGRSRDMAMVTAACCASRRELMSDLGGFDAAYVNGFEDVDLCLRMVRRGLRVRYRGDSVVVHHESMSPGRTDGESANGLLFRRRWGRWPADWERLLGEDGAADCDWADCRWVGPLFGAGDDAALGRAAIRALTDEGRRPAAVESPRESLAADAAEACDTVVLSALNRLFVRVPDAETFHHLSAGESALATAPGPVVAVLSGAGAAVDGLTRADAALVADGAACARARCSGVREGRLGAIDPMRPDPGPERRRLLGAGPGGPGIGWWGPLVGRSDDAAAGRGLLDAAASAGIPVRAMVADAPDAGTDPCPLTLGPQHFRPATWVAHHPPSLADGTSVWEELAIALESPIVGAACFGADGVPPRWVEIAASDAVREVWVPNAFNARTFAAAGIDPSRLRIVPQPFPGAALARPRPPRERNRPFTFLSVIEWTWRTGWDVLLRAWAEEFSPQEGVALRVVIPGGAGAGTDIASEATGHLRRLGHDPDAIADVELVLDRVAAGDMGALYDRADAFVLPTRGEGSGRPILEAAAHGLPVIATAFGGHEELMHPDVAFPVAVAAMVEAPPGLVRDEPHYAGQRLAEPSVTELRAQMRAVAADPSAAASRALGARDLVRERFSTTATARVLREVAPRLAGSPSRRLSLA